ncbi:MAG: shikimate dehydrogenase [Gemmatimonadota bacterium]|nr:shikimate dehydrogenase [Gemmatimonadota bacterium]MDP6528138.1 shikimate dehydrogenase [Gemmatimonadota bacterium]MDP6801748.1 shikimate dehydrogenase [Gemmatimonadota bacterium]
MTGEPCRATGPSPRFLVVGCPVAHSLSPVMMAAAFRAAGVPGEYAAREIPPSSWPDAMDDLFLEGIAGINVTVPHKEGALAGAATASAEARAIGAANTLVRADHGWHAENTDAPGFLDWVREADGGDLLREDALVLGAGGSARAVVVALLRANCPRVWIANRTRPRAEQLANALGAERVSVVERDDASPQGLVVNCTALGMHPADALPLAAGSLAGAGLVMDLVYPETNLVRAAREAGVAAHDGSGLLVAQGARSFQLWTGFTADRRAMREAVEAARHG